MREHIKIDVVMEILSMCMAMAISSNDNAMLEEILSVEQQIYKSDMNYIDNVIEKYGAKVKKIVEASNG